MPLAHQGNHLVTTVTTGWSPDVTCVQSCAFLLSLASSARHIFFFFSDSHHVAVCLLGKWGPFAWTCCRLSVSLPMGILVVSRFRLCWTTLPGTSPPQSFSEQRFPFPLGEDLGGKLVWSQRRRVWNVLKTAERLPGSMQPHAQPANGRSARCASFSRGPSSCVWDALSLWVSLATRSPVTSDSEWLP